MKKAKDIETRIQDIGKEVFLSSQKGGFGLFKKNLVNEFMMDWAMKRPDLKVEMFRFVDVLPTLHTTRQITNHLREYFLQSGKNFPFLLKSGLKLSIATPLTSPFVVQVIKRNISGLAGVFISGHDSQTAHKKLHELWRDGFAFTADILGEAVVSQDEATIYQKRYLELIQGLSQKAKRWQTQSCLENTPLGKIPRVNVSIKCSSLYSQISNLSFRQTVEHLKEQLRPICDAAIQNQVFLNLDMEQNDYRELFLTVAEEIFCESRYKNYPFFGLVIQTYLKCAEQDLNRVIQVSASRNAPLTVRLVKGAYWEYEVILAQKRGWPIPVFTNKAEADVCFERCTKTLLDAFPKILSAFASHNVRSLAHAIGYAENRGLEKNAFEIQMLYGMANSFKNAFKQMGYRVREYSPVGEMLPGIAYLVRRLLENTSNEGFLRAKFFDHAEVKELLKNPSEKCVGAIFEFSIPDKKHSKNNFKKDGPMFANEPLIDFSKPENRDWIDAEIQRTRDSFPLHVCPHISGKKISSLEEKSSVNPSHKNEIVSQYSLSTKKEADKALDACEKARNTWGKRAPNERAMVLQRAADLLQKKRKNLIALIVLEVGKTIGEADADVAEAIDFCRYYSVESQKLFRNQETAKLAGESNLYHHIPRGPCVVVAPWNFPLAILCGMTVGPLVCGNPVIMKPAEQSSGVALELYHILLEAGVETDAIHLLPGLGEVIGDSLVQHPKTHIITFTGSRSVGLGIIEKAAKTHPGQRHIKKVVLEMGGKNALIVDDDADLDEAVLGALHSAFGFSGQKCSALSRIIVLESVYKKFRNRFIEGLNSITIGVAENLESKIGPVIDGKSHKRLMGTIKKYSSKIVAQKELPSGSSQGYFVPPTIFEETDFHSDLGQQEFFGPLVTLFQVKNLEEAVLRMNAVDYALTGGLYSRSPKNIDFVKEHAQVGNLYINREITGALVCRQPFGGFKLSGAGGKAGGPDYLLNFVEPRTVTENTMRRGFAPEVEQSSKARSIRL